MCYTLNIEKILLNYFAKREDDSITFRQLNELSDEIVKACNNGIVVSVNKDSIENAVSKRAEVLSLENGVIKIVNRSNFAIRRIDIINRNMPAVIRDRCVEVCIQYGKK